MAELARAHGIRVVFSSVIPVHNYTPASEITFPLRPPEKIVALNRWLKDYAAANGCVYLDYFAAMVDARASSSGSWPRTGCTRPRRGSRSWRRSPSRR